MTVENKRPHAAKRGDDARSNRDRVTSLAVDGQGGEILGCQSRPVKNFLKPLVWEMVERFKVSVPTAYRHLAHGTVPGEILRTSIDGKHHWRRPLKDKPRRSEFGAKLLRARWALRQAVTCDGAVGEQERQLLEELWTLLGKLSARGQA